MIRFNLRFLFVLMFGSAVLLALAARWPYEIGAVLGIGGNFAWFPLATWRKHSIDPAEQAFWQAGSQAKLFAGGFTGIFAGVFCLMAFTNHFSLFCEMATFALLPLWFLCFGMSSFALVWQLVFSLQQKS